MSAKVDAAALEVVDHARRITESSPRVCCRVDCPQHGSELATCTHRKHPSGWVGLGSYLWVEIDRLAAALEEA